MQKIIYSSGNLLDPEGHITRDGYQTSMVLRYNKEFVRRKNRIKEWDYYCIMDEDYALCLTISDLSYAGVLSASVIDFRNKKHYDKTSLALFPKIKPELPYTSVKGKSHYKTKDAEFTFVVENGKRHLFGQYNNFYKTGENKTLSFDIVLSEEPKDSMVKVTPFKNQNHFYYNQKINCIRADGEFMFFGKKHSFFKHCSLGLLDWGRGVLPYRTKWYWASMSTFLGEKQTLGFNFGKALGNNEEATENMIFVNGTAHKVEQVDINIPRENKRRNYLGTWTFYSSDGRVELIFEPILDRYVPFNVLFLAFIPHQVFGRYSGKLVLDDGKVLKIENELGFAERVVNRW